MELKKCTGMVLREIPYKEKDKLIVVFTLELGKILVKVRGVQSIKSKLASACIPHTLLNLELNNSKNTYTLTGFDIIDSFEQLNLDVNKFYCQEVFLELTESLLIDKESNERWFFNLINYYKELCYSDIDCRVLLIKFVSDFLIEEGLDINLEKRCKICGKVSSQYVFSFRTLSLICSNCMDIAEKVYVLKDESINILKEIFAKSNNELSGIVITTEILKDIMRVYFIILQNILHSKTNCIVEYMKIL